MTDPTISPESTTGDGAHATTTGNGAHATTTGYRAHATTTGNRAHATTTGSWAHATTTGNWAHATTTGNRAHATTTGDNTSSCALGTDAVVRASGANSSIIATYTDIAGRRRHLIGYVGETVLADVWYQATTDGWQERRDILTIDHRNYILTYRAGRYIAGCRNFSAAEALDHWSNPDHYAPISAAILLAAVIANEARVTPRNITPETDTR